MPFAIPQTLDGTGSELERTVFELLRKDLPPEAVLWHRSALDGLEDEERTPFLLMGDSIGIAAIAPLDWQPTDDRLPFANMAAAAAPALARMTALHDLLVESVDVRLIDSTAQLVPVFHRVLILPDFKAADLTAQGLRSQFGTALVIARDEVAQLHDILRQQTPAGRQLSGEGFNAARALVSPTVEIHLRPRRADHSASGTINAHAGQLTLDLPQEQAVKSYAYLPSDQQPLPRDLDTRLVRGVVGSGKSLILLHRAKFLSQIYPDWHILVLTYNRSLADFLRNRVKDLPGRSGDIQIIHFHAWVRQLLLEANLWPQVEFQTASRRGLLLRLTRSQPQRQWIAAELDYYLAELDWIRDQGLKTWDEYAKAARIGREKKLGESQRRQVWEILQEFRAEIQKLNLLDWPELPLRTLEALQAQRIASERYHAILVDEAQDFAPSWFMVIQRLLKLETNMLFMAADVAQKIYRRSLSWKALGIDVTGNRSRVLNRSYRNTYEILRLAYRIVGNDPDILADNKREGDMPVQPDLDVNRMRRGPQPIVLQLEDTSREVEHIARQIDELRQAGYAWEDIAIVHREVAGLRLIQEQLTRLGVPTQIVRGSDINLASQDVKLLTLHSSKGLEFSAVFIADADRVRPRPGLVGEELQAAIADEKRLLYVGMTRARDFLYILHAAPLPMWIAAALSMADSA